MRFRPDCVLEYSYAGATYTNGRWLQRGSLVLWDTNDHYAVYLGVIADARMYGTMTNQNGDTGIWMFTPAD